MTPHPDLLTLCNQFLTMGVTVSSCACLYNIKKLILESSDPDITKSVAIPVTTPITDSMIDFATEPITNHPVTRGSEPWIRSDNIMFLWQDPVMDTTM